MIHVPLEMDAARRNVGESQPVAIAVSCNVAPRTFQQIFSKPHVPSSNKPAATPVCVSGVSAGSRRRRRRRRALALPTSHEAQRLVRRLLPALLPPGSVLPPTRVRCALNIL
eukprot:COSAG01_NODE_19002_length_1038_cov_1.072417_2_plen_112_part_00